MLVEAYYINADLHGLCKKQQLKIKTREMWIISPRSDDQWMATMQGFNYLIRSNSRGLSLKRGFRYESVDHADKHMRLRNLEKKYKKITYD